MNNSKVFNTKVAGFDAVGIRSRAVELLMVPKLGGRVVSLRNLKSSREWLWHQDRPDWLWPNEAGDSFGTSPQAGIDECIPSVAGCFFREKQIPDHGEVWYQNWKLDSDALSHNILKSTVKLPISNMFFSRAIRMTGETSFLFEYSLENHNTTEEPFIWSLHPLKTIIEGDIIELPREVTSLRLDGGLGVPISRGDIWSYPEPFPGIRLDACQVPGEIDERCVKGFAGPLASGWAAIKNAITGDRLELRWDADFAPYLGLWINRGLSGFHHVALEPCTGIPDSLSIAAQEWKTVKTIQGSERLEWSLNIEIS
ncbi:MAG: hypothetical protein LDL24_00695 [Treponema sp.]|nr:hypothetical protein [Treponema sp.]